jgi:hypothetical protein
MSAWILVGTLWAKLFFWADGWDGIWGTPGAGGAAGQVQTQDGSSGTPPIGVWNGDEVRALDGSSGTPPIGGRR